MQKRVWIYHALKMCAMNECYTFLISVTFDDQAVKIIYYFSSIYPVAYFQSYKNNIQTSIEKLGKLKLLLKKIENNLRQ